MLDISGHEIGRLRRLRAFQKDIVVGVWAGPHLFRRADPETLLANSLKRSGHDRLGPLESGTTDNFLVFGIDRTTDAQLDRAAQGEEKDLRGWSKGLEQGGDNYVGVENNPYHGPGCNRDSRRSFRSTAISASISSVES